MSNMCSSKILVRVETEIYVCVFNSICKLCKSFKTRPIKNNLHILFHYDVFISDNMLDWTFFYIFIKKHSLH